MSNVFWSKFTRDLEARSHGLPDFQTRSDEDLRSMPRHSPARRGMSERQFSSSMFPIADIGKPSPQPFEATRTGAAGSSVSLTPQLASPVPAALASEQQQLRDAAAAGAGLDAQPPAPGLFSGIEDTELTAHDVAALFQRRVLESVPTDPAIYRIDDSVPPDNFEESSLPQLAGAPGARATKLSIHEVRSWIAHARSGGMSTSEDPVPPHLEPVIVPPSPRSRSPRTIVALPDSGTYATADRTKGWREVVNKGAAESPSLRALRFGRREYGEQMQREFSAQVTFELKTDAVAAVASLGLDGGIEDSVDSRLAPQALHDAAVDETADITVEGTDGTQSLSMAQAVAPDYGVYYAGADEEHARDAGPASYSPSFSALSDPDFQAPVPAEGVTSVVGLHGGVVVVTRGAALPAWAHAPAQPSSLLPGNAAFPASLSVSSLERAGASGTGSRALAERAKSAFKELVDKRDFQKIRSALYFPHDFLTSGGFPSNSSQRFHADNISAGAADGRGMFTAGEPRGFSTADDDAQRQLMLIFDSDHRTMLHSACMRGDVDMISAFLPPISKRVANQVLSCPDGLGRTCFHAAAISGISEVMLAVMKFAGADRVRDLMRDVDNAGNTCLHLAATRGHVSLCLSLLRVWSCPVEMYNIRGYSPLHEAIEGSHIAVVKMLLEECPHHALSTLANEARDTALHVALRMRPVSIGIVQQLVKYGCKGSRANLFGVRPTELAMQVGAWLAADIIDSSSAHDSLPDTRREAEAAAAASASVAASGPRPPAATDYWGPSAGSPALSNTDGQSILHHDPISSYSGGEVEREIAMDHDPSAASAVHVIVVPSVGTSSSERAMLAAPYSVAVRMRQPHHASDDIATQSGEDGGRSRASTDASLDTSQEALSSDRFSGHVHPSLALSVQAEQRQQQLFRDHVEKRPVAADTSLTTTTTIVIAENPLPPQNSSQQEQEGEEHQRHGTAQAQAQQIHPATELDSHCSNFETGDGAALSGTEAVADVAHESVNAEVEGVIQHLLYSLQLHIDTPAPVYSNGPADPMTVERFSAQERKQQRAAVVVQEETSDRCAPIGDLSWLELEDFIVNARESSLSSADAAVGASWTDWDELMEPPRRHHHAAPPSTSAQSAFEPADGVLEHSQAVPPVPALSSRLVRLPGSDDGGTSANDFVDSNVQLIYIGSSSRPSVDMSAFADRGSDNAEPTEAIARNISSASSGADAATLLKVGQLQSTPPPQQHAHSSPDSGECLLNLPASSLLLAAPVGIHVDQCSPAEEPCSLAAPLSPSMQQPCAPHSSTEDAYQSASGVDQQPIVSAALATAQPTSPRECSRQLATAVADAARSSMLLPGGPLAVFGLPSFPAEPGARTAAAAVLGLAITRANDIFNMRMNCLPDAALAPRASPHPAPQSQWRSRLSEGELFCACLRLQRVWRGHYSRMCVHILRNRIMSAAEPSGRSNSPTITALHLEPAVTAADAAVLSAHSSNIDHSEASFAQNQDDHQLAGSVFNELSSAASDDPSAYIIPHPSNFISPCSLCEEFDHSTREHSVRRSTQHSSFEYPPVAPLGYLNAASDRAMLEDISAAVSRLPMSPEVSVAVRSVEHPDDFREPCIYCERFVHTSEEHTWASNNRQRVLTQDDGISIASTSIGSLGHAVDELNAQADFTNTQPEDAPVDILDSREHPLRPDGATFRSESASLADPSTRAPTPLPLPSCANSSASDVAAAQDVTVVGCSSNAAFFDADGCGLHTDTAIERGDISGVNDEGKEELDGLIVLDDAESECNIDESLDKTAEKMRSRLNEASEHESRMRSTISSARRFALDLERTVLMSELVNGSSNISDADAMPLDRVSPSLREQQRARTRSAGAAKQDRRPLHITAASAPSLQPTPSKPQQSAIFGGIILPSSSTMKNRSQSATSRPKAVASRAPDPPPSLSRPPPPPPSLHRGIYSLARAGPSIISAWQSSHDIENDPPAHAHGQVADALSRTSVARAGTSERDAQRMLATDLQGQSDAAQGHWRQLPDEFADEVQDWLFTRDAAKATAARALALASSKKARSLLPSTLDYAAAVSSAAAAPKDRDTASFSRSIKPAAPASMLRPAGSCAAPRAVPVPGARARSSSPKGQPSALSSIDAAITSMVAGGASGSTATQRHLKRTAARAAPLCAGASGARKNVAAVPAPLQQLFSVIL